MSKIPQTICSGLAALWLATPSAASAQQPKPVPPELRDRIAAATPYTTSNPERTRYYPLSNGLLGRVAQAAIPGAQGIDWKQFMGGAAYAMSYEPTGGPDCDKKREDPKVEFWTLEADPEESRLAVNPGATQGIAFVRGKVRHYVPATNFCETKKYAQEGGTTTGRIYMPFVAKGWSPRNFPATALPSPNTDPAQNIIRTRRGHRRRIVDTIPRLEDRETGEFVAPGIEVDLGGYSSIDLLGMSQAVAEGPGGEAAAAALQQYANAGPASEALKDLPGMVPGAKSAGSLDLNLADQPMARIAKAGGGFFFVHLRVVHTGQEVTPGREYVEFIKTRKGVSYDPTLARE